METSHHKAKLLQWQVKAELVSPIFQRSEHWGSLIIHRCQSSEPWVPETVQVLSSLLEQLELAIQQAHLYQQLQLANQELRQLANVDSLTGVANRRYFDTYLAETWAQLQQEQALFSLILCDIDYFKAYNDHYGHPHGDACLQQVAQAIAQATHRPTDLAARYGGEEFALLLPHTSPEGAQQVAQRLQQNIAALAIPHAQSNLDPHLTPQHWPKHPDAKPRQFPRATGEYGRSCPLPRQRTGTQLPESLGCLTSRFVNWSFRRLGRALQNCPFILSRFKLQARTQPLWLLGFVPQANLQRPSFVSQPGVG